MLITLTMTSIPIESEPGKVSAPTADPLTVLLLLIIVISIFFSIQFVTGCVRVLENLESPGKTESQNPGLENLENHSRSLKVLENQVISWAVFLKKIVTLNISHVFTVGHKFGCKFMRIDR